MADPRARLPLPPLDFHVLLALFDGPRHAYGLSNAVEASPGSGVRLEIGSLYRILSRLATEGLIEHVAARGASAGHEARRRYYRITPFGRQVARVEAARLEAVLRYARKYKLLPSGGSR